MERARGGRGGGWETHRPCTTPDQPDLMFLGGGGGGAGKGKRALDINYKMARPGWLPEQIPWPKPLSQVQKKEHLDLLIPALRSATYVSPNSMGCMSIGSIWTLTMRRSLLLRCRPHAVLHQSPRATAAQQLGKRAGHLQTRVVRPKNDAR